MDTDNGIQLTRYYAFRIRTSFDLRLYTRCNFELQWNELLRCYLNLYTIPFNMYSLQYSINRLKTIMIKSKPKNYGQKCTFDISYKEIFATLPSWYHIIWAIFFQEREKNIFQHRQFFYLTKIGIRSFQLQFNIAPGSASMLWFDQSMCRVWWQPAAVHNKHNT